MIDACRDWKRTLLAHKTWVNFKVDVGLAFKELREPQQTDQRAGFASQNATNVNSMETFAAETFEAIENLANATVQYQNINRNLTATNTTITNNLMEANRQLAEALNTIAALQINCGNG